MPTRRERAAQATLRCGRRFVPGFHCFILGASCTTNSAFGPLGRFPRSPLSEPIQRGWATLQRGRSCARRDARPFELGANALLE
jgi:hypothetical protein